MNALLIALVELLMEIVTGAARLMADSIGEWAFVPALLVAVNAIFAAPFVGLVAFLRRRKHSVGACDWAMLERRNLLATISGVGLGCFIFGVIVGIGLGRY